MDSYDDTELALMKFGVGQPVPRMSLVAKDIGRASKGAPVSCNAICTAIELEPGAK